VSSTIALSYWLWTDHCHKQNGFWPYPIFDEVGYEGRVVLFMASALIMGISTLTLKWVYTKVNGRDMDARAVQEQKTI